MEPSVKVRFFGTLRRYSPPDADHYPIRSGLTIRDIVETLGIPEEKLNLVFLNGTQADFNKAPDDGDILGFYPYLGGG